MGQQLNPSTGPGLAARDSLSTLVLPHPQSGLPEADSIVQLQMHREKINLISSYLVAMAGIDTGDEGKGRFPDRQSRRQDADHNFPLRLCKVLKKQDDASWIQTWELCHL